MTILRESARWAPHCMACDLGNPNHDLLCLAHSNRLADGKGMLLKSLDEKGAITCFDCHNLIDGRVGKLSREEAQAMHRRAHIRTVKWWVKTGYLTPEHGQQLIQEATHDVHGA